MKKQKKAAKKPYIPPNAWSAKEIRFMRYYYPQYETRWIAEQIGRTTLAVVRKAGAIGVAKAPKYLWKGNRGPKTAFKRFSK